MTEELILAVDAGTQSIRAALVDPRGEIQAFHQVTVDPYFSVQPGWAEQDPEYLWGALCEAVTGVMAAASDLSGAVKALTLATQRLTMVNVDPEGRPLRPAIIWADNRRADVAAVVPAPFRLAAKVAGLAPLVEFSVGYARSNWIRQHQPEIWNRTHRYLFLSGFFTHRLTGEFIDSAANVFGTVPYSVRKASWVGPGSLNGRLFPIEPEKLPRLVPPGDRLGEVTATAAEATGLPIGLPVIAAASDKACDVVGAGCIEPDQGSISFGTTATFNVPISRYLEVQRFLPPYPAVIPGQFHTEIAVLRGLWLVSWFKEEFGLAERLAAEESGRAPEELLDELIRDIPAGSMGLMTLPTWMSSPNGDPYGKGAVWGFGDVHTRAHLYRSILEGIVFALRQGADMTVKATGVPLRVIRASGGGSASDVLMQITADVFGVPTQRPHTAQTSVVGAAIAASREVSWYSDIATAVSAMTRQDRTFEPQAQHHDTYDALFRSVFSPARKRFAPLNREIARITGYPDLG